MKLESVRCIPRVTNYCHDVMRLPQILNISIFSCIAIINSMLVLACTARFALNELSDDPLYSFLQASEWAVTVNEVGRVDGNPFGPDEKCCNQTDRHRTKESVET